MAERVTLLDELDALVERRVYKENPHVSRRRNKKRGAKISKACRGQGPHPQLQLLQGFPNLQVVEVTTKEIQAMLQNMLDYPLRPRDALHLATMQRLGCFNLASNDHHFDVIPAIQRFSIEVA